MHLLDTDILIWLTRSNPQTLKILDFLKNKAPTHISTVTIAEIYKNIYPSEIIDTDEVIYNHIILPLDDQTAKQAGLYWRDYHPKLKELSITDCMIAATAKKYDLILLSTNTRHLPMPDIKVINPLK